MLKLGGNHYTILVPTHNRPRKVRRLLEYLAKYDCNVVLMDSSEAPIDSAPYRNVVHKKDTSLTFKDKVVLGCELINTEFVVLAADDDFPLIENIERNLVNYFEQSLMIGNVGLFDEKFLSKSFWYQKNSEISGIFDDSNGDIFMENYSQVLWGCFRTSSLYECFRAMREVNFKNDNFIELFIASWMLNDKGILKLDKVLCVREVSHSDSWGRRHESLRSVYVNNIQDFLLDISEVIKGIPPGKVLPLIAAYLKIRRSGNKPGPVSIKLLMKKWLSNFGFYFGRKYISTTGDHCFSDVTSIIVSQEKG
jgi:glycosyltransferase domain-containing protein